MEIHIAQQILNITEKDITMTAQADNPYLTITLTDRNPVKIKKEEWPVLAEATDKEFDNQYESQANRVTKWALRVRQHQDGRAIVYAVYEYGSRYRNERNFNVRGGELLANSDELAEAIQRVGKWMAEQEHADRDAARWPTIVNNCIADLPAVEL